tara:strand:+ start:81 stop:701 length:621 start_codon:yes stop_codon:yes gene_type:complete
LSKNYKLFKRICDLTFALFLLIILIPLIILISILIIFFDGYPLFFKQLRVGKDEKVFQIYKFRTMRSYSKELSDSDLTFSDKYRISRFGSFLRKLSLDELPQLFNVIKGDMSFIGPRPLLIDYLSFYNSEQKQRHLVIPGISGLAQVNGRNSISWEERFKYDIYYVNNQNLFLDLKIIFLTFLKVIIMSNINDKKSVTMTPFKGEK